MLCSYGILVLLLVSVEAQVQLLTSSYSQVSRSGSARSHAGQTPWTHSSDAQIVRGQNLARKKPNRRISILKKKDKLVHFEDGTGEVVQERFNPRPWFAYEAAGNNEPESSDMDLTVPFASFPLSLHNKDKDKVKPSTLLKPPFDMNNNGKPPSSLNTYGSPYNSYNPNSGPDKPESTKPPNNFVTPNNEYLPPSESETEPNPDHSVSNNSDDIDISPPSVPYKYSPDPDDIDDNEHQYQDENAYNQDSSDITKLPAYIDHDPNIHGYSHDFSHHFPHDHPPIYYEVKTTTTEAPENQRLNKRPYSYYYIGRKLWYIPLYFSVYFIIYIFVLILKSIARHKITFNQYFEEDKREMKDMHEEHDEHVHELEHHIFNNIMTAKRKYIM